MAAMHGRFTGSQIIIQNGNVNYIKYLHYPQQFLPSMSSTETFPPFQVMSTPSSVHRCRDRLCWHLWKHSSSCCCQIWSGAAHQHSADKWCWQGQVTWVCALKLMDESIIRIQLQWYMMFPIWIELGFTISSCHVSSDAQKTEKKLL